MKKSVLSLLAGSALLIAPMAASALTPMTADGLKEATGQAGVSIAIDGVKLESYVGAVKYIDGDGYQTLMETVKNDVPYMQAMQTWIAGGMVGDKPVQATADANGRTAITIGSKHKIQYINAIIGGTTSDNAQALTGQSHTYTNTMGVAQAAVPEVVESWNELGGDPLAYDEGIDDGYIAPVAAQDAVAAGEYLFETRALTIDAGTCRLLTTGLAANISAAANAAEGTELKEYGHAYMTTPVVPLDIAGVIIGLPTLEIVTSADSYAIGIEQVDDAGHATALNNGKDFIAISKEASSLAILGGVLEIAPH